MYQFCLICPPFCPPLTMMRPPTRRKFLQYGLAGVGTSLLLKGCKSSPTASGGSDQPIVIGSIYDQTGGLSSLGVQQIACQELAIEEINANGGLLGREVQVKLYDGQSDVQKSAQLAQQLLLQDKVDVLIGCLSSAAREAVRPVVSKYGGLYFYPSQYEGGVCDKQTFLCGVTAAGIIDTLVKHAAEKMQAKTLYVIAADYNFGQISDKWVRYYGQEYGVSVTQSDFIPFDVSDFSTTISKIQQAAPDAVVSILVGDAHEGFFGQWANSGLKEKIPVLAATLSHPYNQDGSLRPEKADILAVRSYWQEDPEPAMQKFVSKFKEKFGEDKYLFELGFDCYVAPMMWAQAVSEAGTTEPEEVTKVLEGGMVYDGPQGPVSFDRTHHIDHTIYVLRSTADQKFELVDGPFKQIPATDDQDLCDLEANPETDKQFVPTI